MFKKFALLLVVLVAVYLTFIFVTPPDAASLERFDVTVMQLRLLGISVAVPLILVWVAAFYGFSRFKSYAEKIKTTPDGQGLATMANGLMVLALGLPLQSVISSSLTYAVRSGMLTQPTSTIVSHYTALIFPLVAFWLLCQGSRHLVKTVPNAAKRRRMTVVLAIGCLLVLSALYVVATFSNPSRTVAVPPVARATYYLSDPLIATTIVLPYLVIWALGMIATLNIFHYQQAVQGSIYKAALVRLSLGVGAIMISSIIMQFFSAASSLFAQLKLNALLGIVYVLIAVIAIGYILIAIGAQKLKKLEEVV